jgi:muramoyltetrapeptide carboxypeptidase
MEGFVKPPAIKRGDFVGIVAPSDAVDKVHVAIGVAVLEEWGLKVKLGNHLFATVGDFAAGTPEERKEDLLMMIGDPEVKAIWAAAGGYAAMEVLPVFTKETVEKLKKSPKWFVGFSDVCVLLNALASFKIASIQGPNLTGLIEKDERSNEWIRKMIFGEEIEEIGSDANWQPLIQGEAVGRLLVSNLDSLVVTFGTRFDPIMHGSGDLILGIEEWLVEKNILQRQIDMILNHKRSSRIKGMIMGRFVGITEKSYPEWGKKVTSEALIEGRVRFRGDGMPLVMLADFGHPLESSWLVRKFSRYPNLQTFLALPNGIKVKLTVGVASANLRFLEKITG